MNTLELRGDTLYILRQFLRFQLDFMITLMVL